MRHIEIAWSYKFVFVPSVALLYQNSLILGSSSFPVQLFCISRWSRLSICLISLKILNIIYIYIYIYLNIIEDKGLIPVCLKLFLVDSIVPLCNVKYYVKTWLNSNQYGDKTRKIDCCDMGLRHYELRLLRHVCVCI